MKVIKRSSSGYTQDPTKYFNFSRFEKECGDFVLIEGAFEKSTLWSQFNFSPQELKKILKKKVVRLEFEEPNKFFIFDNPNEYDGDFYKIYTLCPYTSKWLNKQNNVKKRVPIFFPFNEEFIPKKEKKKYDIIYTGHIVSDILLSNLKTMSKFNYRFVSNSAHELVTDHSASYEKKMELIAQSKITLIHNVLYPKRLHLPSIWSNHNWQANEAFKLIPNWYDLAKIISMDNVVVPQLKSRVFEAAFGRSLILCKRDPFNVIENFFEPEKEFVYFEEENLEKTVKNILKNYSKYEKVIERAYKRAVNNYTTEKFVKNYLKKLP